MDQTPRPLPTTPRARSSVTAQRALLLLAGVAIGAIVVLATLFLAGQSSPRIVYRDRPASQIDAGKIRPSLPPDDGSKPPGTPPTGTNSPPTGNAQTEAMGTVPPNSNATPLNPLNLPPKKPVSMPPKQISGQISPGPSVPMSTGIGSGGSFAPLTINPEERQTPKARLMLVRMSVSDPRAAIQSLRSLAAQVGGAAIEFDETAGKEDPEGAILFVPDPKADQAEKQLTSVGEVVVNDHWIGNNSDRVDRVESAAQSRISDLRVRRQELLAKYFDDAPQIKNVDEDASRIQRSIDAFRAKRAGPKTTVIKIKFLG